MHAVLLLLGTAPVLPCHHQPLASQQEQPLHLLLSALTQNYEIEASYPPEQYRDDVGVLW